MSGSELIVQDIFNVRITRCEDQCSMMYVSCSVPVVPSGLAASASVVYAASTSDFLDSRALSLCAPARSNLETQRNVAALALLIDKARGGLHPCCRRGLNVR